MKPPSPYRVTDYFDSWGNLCKALNPRLALTRERETEIGSDLAHPDATLQNSRIPGASCYAALRSQSVGIFSIVIKIDDSVHKARFTDGNKIQASLLDASPEIALCSCLQTPTPFQIMCSGLWSVYFSLKGCVKLSPNHSDIVTQSPLVVFFCRGSSAS